MSLTTKQIIDEFNRPDPPVQPQYGEQCEEERPDEDEWPTPDEVAFDLANHA